MNGADLVARLRADDLFSIRGPDYEPIPIPASDLRKEAADRIEAAEAERDRLRAVLIWYENNAAGCRLIHSGGDAHRAALAADGGNRARAALQKEPQP